MNGDESIYAAQIIQDGNGRWNPAATYADVGGLTKREYLASLAMQGLASAVCGYTAGRIIHCDEMAADAVACADALIAALSAPTRVKHGQ